jgi:hypothetical protein
VHIYQHCQSQGSCVDLCCTAPFKKQAAPCSFVLLSSKKQEVEKWVVQAQGQSSVVVDTATSTDKRFVGIQALLCMPSPHSAILRARCCCELVRRVPCPACAACDVSLGVLHVTDVHVTPHTLTTQQALPGGNSTGHRAGQGTLGQIDADVTD